MTPAEKIAKLRAKVAAATAAPWRVEVDHDLWKAIRHGYGLSGRMVADCLLGGDAPAVAAMRNHFDALLDVADKAEDLRAWVHALGGADAWRGSMGDDGQGHDEGSTRAAMMLGEFDAAIERLATKTPGDQE